MRILALIIVFISITLPLFADADYDRGRNFYVYRNYDKAKEFFLKSAEGRNNGNAYYFLGEIEKLLENYEQAVHYYTLAIEQRNITTQYLRNAYWNLLLIAEQRADIDTVIKTSRSMWLRLKDEAAKKRIEDTIDRYLWTDNEEAIAKYNEAIKLKKKGTTEEAETLFKEAISISNSFLAPRVELGLTAYQRGDMSAASAYLSPVASRIPFYAEIHLIMGDINIRQQNWRRAAEHYDKVFEFGLLDRNTEFNTLLRRANSYHKIGNFDKAAPDLERALEINSGSLPALILLASIELDRENYRAALGYLRRAERIDRGNPFVLLATGEILAKNNDSSFAGYYERLLNLRKDNPNHTARELQAFAALMKHHFDSRNYKKVLEVREALPSATINYDLNRITAYSHYHLKEYSSAITIFEGIALKDEDHYILARAYALHGNRARAREILAFRYRNQELIEAARKDPILSPILKDVEKEREPVEKPLLVPDPVPEKKEPEITDNDIRPEKESPEKNQDPETAEDE